MVIWEHFLKQSNVKPQQVKAWLNKGFVVGHIQLPEGESLTILHGSTYKVQNSVIVLRCRAI